MATFIQPNAIADALNASNPPNPMHPYYPVEVEIANYLANKWHFGMLLLIFGSGCGVVLGATYTAVKKIRPDIRNAELWTIIWFVMSGAIHTFFEGYYVWNWRELAGLQGLFAQLWKEYAYSDSRYLTMDSQVLCLESITVVCKAELGTRVVLTMCLQVVWGPGCFLVAWLILNKHPLRYPVQMLISMGQMYGAVCYYATSLVDAYILDKHYSRPEAYYFWCYFVGTNFFWIVIPLCKAFE